MAFSSMLRRVALLRTDVSEELNASFIGVTRIGELGTTIAVNWQPRKLRRNLVCLRSVRRLLVTAIVVPMKNGVFWDVTQCGCCKNRRCNIPGDVILHSHCRENLKSYLLVCVRTGHTSIRFASVGFGARVVHDELRHTP
jgi:hypothetical protein